MLQTRFTLCFLLLLTTTATILPAQDDVIRKAAQEQLVTMPEPPLGYSVTKHPLVAGEKLIGFQIQAIKEESVDKVLIKVELREIKVKEARSAATKAYINGLASGLVKAGLKVTNQKLPDFSKHDFTKPIVAEVQFESDELDIYMHKRIFFTPRG